MATPSAAQLADFQNFITGVMGISALYLPITSPIITTSLSIALDFVNTAIALIADGSGDLYALALNNLAADFLVQWAQDQPGQTFFQNARSSWGVNSFSAGVIRSAHDESTGSDYAMPKFYQNLSLMDLQNLKTPYGRQYLAIAQQFGSLWGLS